MTAILSASEIAEIPSPRLPIGPQIAHLLSEFASLSIQLFTILSLPSSQSNPSLTLPIYERLGKLDQQLSNSLKILHQHQVRQREINRLIDELRTVDTRWKGSAETINECIEELEPILKSGRVDRESIKLAARKPLDDKEEDPLTANSILSYARLLAPFTSAPPSSLYPPHEKLSGIGAKDPTGRSLPLGAIPPFPTEGTMRRGRLQFGREKVGLGETNEIGARKLDQPEPSQPNGIHPPPPPPSDSKTRSELEARQRREELVDSRHGGMMMTEEEEEPEETFEFDLDLNPDL